MRITSFQNYVEQLHDQFSSDHSINPITGVRALEQSEDDIARHVQHRLLANLAEINLGRLGKANNDIRVLTR